MGDQRVLSGWGRSTASRGTVLRPETVDDISEYAAKAGERGAIARGLGRSYGDQATNGGGAVVDLTAMATLPTTITHDGLITIRAGVSLDDLLRWIVPQGWFVPVTPGTRFVTIGGAIAADIHGKNHHVDGSIGDHLTSLEVVLADGSVVQCGPSRRPDLFWATVGGLGLTGVVTSATMRLRPIETSRVAVDTARLADLDALVDAMRAADETATYSVAWIDLMATGSHLGRSILTTGDFATVDQLDSSDSDPLRYRAGSPLGSPPWVPNGLMRPLTIRAFDEAWFRLAPNQRAGELQSIARYFHPLDGIRDWNRIYGSKGFLQWQMAVPDGEEDTLRRIIDDISMSGVPSFLAVLKRFGPANPGPLSFPLQGWTLAADFPAAHPGLAAVLDGLDRQVVDAGGRIYLAKDGRLDPALVPAMYPRLDEWRSVRQAVDPAGVWQSDLARRLRL